MLTFQAADEQGLNFKAGIYPRLFLACARHDALYLGTGRTAMLMSGLFAF